MNTLKLNRKQINELISMSHEFDKVDKSKLDIVNLSIITGGSMAIKQLCLGYDAKAMIAEMLKEN